MKSPQTYLSIPEAAQRIRDMGLSVSTAQVRRWVRKGKLAALELPNGRAQIHPDDLAAFLPQRSAS